jgi:hypothetical protein
MFYVGAPTMYRFIKWDGTNEQEILQEAKDYMEVIYPGWGDDAYVDTLSSPGSVALHGRNLLIPPGPAGTVSPPMLVIPEGQSMMLSYRKGISLGSILQQPLSDARIASSYDEVPE